MLQATPLGPREAKSLETTRQLPQLTCGKALQGLAEPCSPQTMFPI